MITTLDGRFLREWYFLKQETLPLIQRRLLQFLHTKFVDFRIPNLQQKVQFDLVGF